MHSWLPDAHSQAPAPISALMSGVLLTVAFYAILRFKAVVDLAVGPGFSRALLVIVALLSLAVAASLLLTQRDYKRMLAYRSIEHMGLIALGAAAGIPLAIAAVLLHILGHGLAKSVLFLTSGEIMAAEGTSQIDGVRTLLARRPALGGVFGIGLVALLGLPALQPVRSELLMARAEFEVGLGWAAVVAVVAMVVIFVAVVGHARHMLLGPSTTRRAVRPRHPRWVAAPLVGGLVVCGLIGVFAWPLSGLLAGRGPRGGPVNPSEARCRRSSIRPGRHRLAGTVSAARPGGGGRGLFAEGMRLALVSGHDDGDAMRAVVPLHRRTSRSPGRAARPRRPGAPDGADVGRAVVPGQPLRTRAGRHVRHRAPRPPPAPPPGPPSALAGSLASDAPRVDRTAPNGRPTPGRSRSSPSRVPASTRSRSARCTPGSSSPGTSASGWWGRPSCA